jgi:hypothetical protein
MATLDQTTIERFQTVLPNGTVSPAFIDARGRQVVMPGHIDPRAFADEANALIELQALVGMLENGCPLMGHTVKPHEVISRWARPEVDAGGELSLEWNVAPGDEDVVPVTLAEA